MERIPEPDLMDDPEQARAYADADFSEPHEAFVQHFRSRFPDFFQGHVLDLGCGTADVIIRFAQSLPEIRITGIDGAQAMLDIGTYDVRHKGFAHQIILRKCILPEESISDRKYDAVISNSLLHHLPDPGILWQTIRQYAQANSPVFVMDLLRPDTVQLARDMVNNYAGDSSPILQKDFFNSLLAAYSVQEIRQQLYRSGLSYLHTDVVSDRHVLIWGKYHV